MRLAREVFEDIGGEGIAILSQLVEIAELWAAWVGGIRNEVFHAFVDFQAISSPTAVKPKHGAVFVVPRTGLSGGGDPVVCGGHAHP